MDFCAAESASKYEEKLVRLGDWTIFSCGLQKPKEQYFCYLYHPNGNLVYKGEYCYSYSIGVVGLNEIGKWRCIVGIEEAMEGVEFVVELKQIGKRSTFVFVPN